MDFSSHETPSAAATTNSGNTAINSGDALGGTYTDSEGLIDSAFNDGLRCNNGEGTVMGRGDAELLDEDDGDDSINGRSGSDTMDEGVGFDYPSFCNNPAFQICRNGLAPTVCPSPWTGGRPS